MMKICLEMEGQCMQEDRLLYYSECTTLVEWYYRQEDDPVDDEDSQGEEFFDALEFQKVYVD